MRGPQHNLMCWGGEWKRDEYPQDSPEIAADERMSSEQPLLPVIQDEIRASGRISFHRFMELCLYHPQHGYYCSERVRLGKLGDFYTSAHTAPVFGRILARRLERAWRERGEPSRFELIELGPGDGQLACELLSWIEQRFPEMFSCLRYTGIERSASLRSRLEEVLQPFAGRARALADWENVFAPKYILANEFFDALPVHLLVWSDGRWRERYVCLEGQRLAWCEGEPSSPELAQEAESSFAPGLPLSQREDGWVAEVSPQAAEWMQKITSFWGRGPLQGGLLLIDYGYTIEEWQQGRFPQGSALAYRQHQVVDDLLSHPGDQDLTAHVNFTQLIEAGKRAGLRVRFFDSQARFLMELGREDEFQDIFADCASEAERLRRARLLKTLILPQGMGETFRVVLME
jgi:SAM-dependent MidA family methyltransferase